MPKKKDVSDVKETSVPMSVVEETVKKMVSEELAKNQGPQVTASGVVGTLQRYSTDKKDYLDPRERLYAIPELKKFALKDNYILEWDVEVSDYEKRDGTKHREPRFKVEMWRWPTEAELEEAKEKGNTSLTKDTQLFVGRHLQSEDDLTAKKMADELGLLVGKDFNDFDELMDEMRIERIKQWMLDLFFKNRHEETRDTGEEMAISGTVTQVRGKLNKVHNPGTKDEIVESEKIIRS